MRKPVGRTQRRASGERKPREQRWAQLVEVATEVFFEKGYDAASLQDIADRLGMLKGSLYYYIQSKEDLLYELISEVHKAGLANIKTLAAQPGHALERLHMVVVGHVEHVCRNLTSTAVFLHELQALPRERQAEIIGAEGSYRGVFQELLIEGKADGLVRADLDVKVGALSILGSLNWMYRWFRPGGEFTPREIGEQFADLVVRSVASEKGIARWEEQLAAGSAPSDTKAAAKKSGSRSRSRRASRARTG